LFTTVILLNKKGVVKRMLCGKPIPESLLMPSEEEEGSLARDK
jgi:hypothetical protein